jgi:membrane peptidoglycan carboxypeptidase
MEVVPRPTLQPTPPTPPKTPTLQPTPPIPRTPLPPPRGRYNKTHFKRKHLRRTNQRLEAMRWWQQRWFIVTLITIVLLTTTAMVVTSAAFVQRTTEQYQQQVMTLADILPKDNLKMYDEHGTLFYQSVEKGLQTSVPLSEISVNLINAEIATEDSTFWSNPGFDITGIIRAALDDLQHGQVISGASTITQQLIKNTIVGDDVNIQRKLNEIILAPDVTRQYTKQQILTMYLNTIYYGEQSYGADAAAFTYFDLKDTGQKTAASQLDIAQAAMLAGIPSSPVARDPFLHPQAAYTRFEDVLDRMYTQHYITRQQEQAALIEGKSPHFLHHGIVNNMLAPHFAIYALNELSQEMHMSIAALARSGYSVTTTLNLALQNKVLAIAQEHIRELVYSNNVTDASEVLINPHNGAINVLLGNINPSNPQYGAFDVATQGYRQPGSAFKPFIYATAFEQGISPGTPVLDGPLTIQMCCGLPPYVPQNYDQHFHGLISFRYALANSFNIPAVKLLMRTGVEQSLQTALSMGITNYEGTPNYTMVLGSLSVRLIDMTSAYGAFATGGIHVPPHSIDTVKNMQGQVVYQTQPKGTRVLTPQIAYMITSVLSDNNARTYEFGPCSSLLLYSNSETDCYEGNPGLIRPAAVKTGTSNDFRDNWTIGYTPDYVMGVWAGNNDNSPMVNVIGVTGAGPIWHESMLLAEQGLPVKNFPNPGNLVQATVHYPGITTTDWYLPQFVSTAQTRTLGISPYAPPAPGSIEGPPGGRKRHNH